MRAVSAAALVLGLAAVATALKEPPTSLQIGVLKRVDDCPRRSTNGDKLTMHYRGTLFSDGSQFDASYDRGVPFDFTLGKGQVIKGWDQGLLGMCVGEKRKLTIPSDMGYGDRGFPPVIPAKATLVFVTELLAINGDTFGYDPSDSAATAANEGHIPNPLPTSNLINMSNPAPTSLQIEVTQRGTNESVKSKSGDKLTMHYRGTLLSNGSKFDASYDRGQPFQFTIGKGQVIQGWDQGLLDMAVGEKRKLTIPYNMAYGDRGFPPVIPAKATLVFETELLKIN
ncbi:hypothetical protein GQ42DRAFT_181644 [Ramicandelaber brevisporus]|nr:hypothetical protein GQ42DRAFT_181644 [Ramicandelaber brevisporus]